MGESPGQRLGVRIVAAAVSGRLWDVGPKTSLAFHPSATRKRTEIRSVLPRHSEPKRREEKRCATLFLVFWVVALGFSFLMSNGPEGLGFTSSRSGRVGFRH